ncbi:MAG: nitronate monooxygenase [Pseudomonadales bacterium]|nr:nitronate monooxygenase [Pseudomonadales bacterium]
MASDRSVGLPPTAITRLLGLQHAIVQAPMAGAQDTALTIAVSRAGGLGMLPCGMLSAAQIRAAVTVIREATDAPFGLNFFAHQPPVPDTSVNAAWLEKLRPLYAEYGLEPPTALVDARRPFDRELFELVLALQPPVVSFHFGLPDPTWVRALQTAGCKVLSTATTLAEGQFLQAAGVDAVIAQGLEAGGHRGCFLDCDPQTQIGTFALVPLLVDKLHVPVIAAGGIADGRGVAAAFLLGASAVQIGTAYLRCPESTIGPLYRQALANPTRHHTRLTNVLTGRTARGMLNRTMRELGPLSDSAPTFPLAASALAPLRAMAEVKGSDDASPLWAGQAVSVAPHTMDAAAFTHHLVTVADRLLPGAGS